MGRAPRDRLELRGGARSASERLFPRVLVDFALLPRSTCSVVEVCFNSFVICKPSSHLRARVSHMRPCMPI
eukprot:5771257-Alexandrium_andersonii.AAC.1